MMHGPINIRFKKIFLDCLTIEEECATLLREVVNSKPNNTPSHPRRPESSATSLWEPQISHHVS